MDALANLGIIFGGALVLVTRSALPDLVVGAAISLVVLYAALKLFAMLRPRIIPMASPKELHHGSNG
jgi:Co/Zn/Cd efflux system component